MCIGMGGRMGVPYLPLLTNPYLSRRAGLLSSASDGSERDRCALNPLVDFPASCSGVGSPGVALKGEDDVRLCRVGGFVVLLPVIEKRPN